MSSISPTPWALIAARSSGASAIRSTSCWASSLASSRRQTSSTSSLSSASSSARLTASLSSAPCTASSTTGPCSTRAIARSTASLSTAATIASSAATSTARSIPVALVTVRAPRTPTPEQPRRERQVAVLTRVARRSQTAEWSRFPSRGEYTFAAPADVEALEQAVDERRLRREDLPPRRLRVEPLGPVDLGELALAAAARRPLHRECVAAQRRRVELGLGRPASTTLPPFWRTDPSSISASGRERRRRAQLLPQLAQRAVPQVLALLGFPLRDRPGPEVPLRPEGPAGMDQQHLGRLPDDAKEKDPGAVLRGHGASVVRRRANPASARPLARAPQPSGRGHRPRMAIAGPRREEDQEPRIRERRDGVALARSELEHVPTPGRYAFAVRRRHLDLPLDHNDPSMLVNLVLLQLLAGRKTQQDHPRVLGGGEDLRLVRLCVDGSQVPTFHRCLLLGSARASSNRQRDTSRGGRI